MLFALRISKNCVSQTYLELNLMTQNTLRGWGIRGKKTLENFHLNECMGSFTLEIPSLIVMVRILIKVG